MYSSIKPNTKFFIQVDRTHKLYIEECGNKKGVPVVYLHGGPGGSISAKNRRLFNPKKYWIILFDQRGSGKSKPSKSIINNSTNKLIDDMEKIRGYLKIKKWLIVGGSWGSTLALTYSIKNPSKVLGLILRGIFLGTKEEASWAFNDSAKFFYPEIINEIKKANNEFLKNLGFIPDIFAYPYGEYNYEIKQITKEYFKAAFGQHSGTIYNGIDVFELPRFSLNEQYGDLKRFKFAANSYGLQVKNILPKENIVKNINPPLLGFNLLNNIESQIKCYPSHNIEAKLIKLGDKRIEVRFDREFPKGRTRVNCTTNDKGKWRWTGFQFLNP